MIAAAVIIVGAAFGLGVLLGVFVTWHVLLADMPEFDTYDPSPQDVAAVEAYCAQLRNQL